MLSRGPSFALVFGAPGGEEANIAAIRDVLGQDVPIIGGSSADNTVAYVCASPYCSGVRVLKPIAVLRLHHRIDITMPVRGFEYTSGEVSLEPLFRAII